MIIINFKNYSTNLKLIKRAQLIQKYLPKAIIAVPSTDIFEVTAETKLKVFAEHIDWREKGKTTGFIIPEQVKQDGAIGTLLNHSEHKLALAEIKKTMKRAAQTKLKVILCASSIAEAKKLIPLKPMAIAFEDPKLIGSGKAVTQFRSSDIKKFAQLFKRSKVTPLCGAGISNTEDIKAAHELGCKGVLIASALANSTDKQAEALLISLSKL